MPCIPPFLKSIIRKGVDRILEAKGIRLPGDFHLRQRVQLLLHSAEPDVEGAAASILAEGMHVIDIGANTGVVTRTFSRLVGKTGRVLAFEPDPTNNEFLRWNTRNCGNVETFPLGFSDTPGKAELYLNPVSGTGNALNREDEGWKSVTIECSTVDNFLADRNPSRLDLIKIDVEGAEVAVLRGMRETVRKFPELCLIIEYCPKNLTQSGLSTAAFFQELGALGYQFQPISREGKVLPAVSPEGMEKCLNQSGYVNLLCIRASAAVS